MAELIPVLKSPLSPASLDELLQLAEEAHGHLCAGQILGVRMAMLALDRLGVQNPTARHLPDGTLNPDRKRLVTFVEIDRCATDAIGVVTGCRVGKRALKLRDWGKMAATFVDLEAKLAGNEYKGLRVVALESSKQCARELYPELDKNVQQMKAYREMPDAELFDAQWVRVPLPPSEFPGFRGQRVVCDGCGEGVNFDRFIEREGQRLCLACAEPESVYFRAL
ncbi:formylmethanofuran dehydrogenase subunit E [Bryocella elongata]|uniref:Formylmethanofuran dehydrogenase subunit E n=1 Tax=Bryocella elongata TaxID=863522 RepID=A0A1H5WC90_9BACT|nr:FmdE family protein [Bryocella elongata]SEF96978.1 formylmethanofuran dehydrogenase subunit E [Bryocella elongata]